MDDPRFNDLTIRIKELEVWRQTTEGSVLNFFRTEWPVVGKIDSNISDLKEIILEMRDADVAMERRISALEKEHIQVLHKIENEFNQLKLKFLAAIAMVGLFSGGAGVGAGRLLSAFFGG